MSLVSPDPPYKAGTIKRIKLNNFMCHEHFELTLGPSVNFVIGPNGSGKSAILTGLVIALGGRATITGRAKKMSEFIKYGKSLAKISVVLHNYEKVMEKDAAFKPDDYGKFITVEKYLFRDDASRLVIKNDKDKKVSERKQELDEIIEHFGILINNPICILNQEVSKTFLHSKKPEDKFDLFMKATNLEQIEMDYQAAELSHKEWDGCNDRNTFAFKQLDKEYNACKEKTGFLENRAKINDVREKLNQEYIWAMIRDNEKVCDSLSEKIQSLENALKEAKSLTETRKGKIQQYKDDIKSYKTDAASTDERLGTAKKKFEDAHKNEQEIKSKRVFVSADLDKYRRKISQFKKDKADLEKSISDIKNQFRERGDQNQERELKKEEIIRLEAELPNERARESNLRLQLRQLSDSMISVRTDLHAATMKVSELKNKISQNAALLRRLKNGQENSIRKYGDFVVKIREEIELAHNLNRFKRKPLGPLGFFLKLKSQDVAGPLELHLGRGAHAFVCDNHSDMQILKSIFRKTASVSTDFRHPMIIVRPFAQRHNVSRFKAHHDEYRTLLDYLDIEEDPIFNAVVDRNFLESILFVPDYAQAESLMIDPNLVPKNTRMAYTRDCSQMYPRNSKGGYRSFSHNQSQYSLFSESNIQQIKDKEREIQRFEVELRDAENVANKYQTSLNVQRKEYDSYNGEIQKLLDEIRRREERLIELKTAVASDDSPQELAALETELNELLERIAREKVIVERTTSDLNVIDMELKTASSEKISCRELIESHEKSRKQINQVIEKTNNSLALVESELNQKQIFITSKISEKKELEEKLDKLLENVARSKQNMTDNERPATIRATEFLKEEVRKIEAQLRVQEEETQDPEEMMENLKKRMKEIENLTGLKDLNQQNFTTAGKSLDQRKEGVHSLKTNTVGSVGTCFTSVMRPMGMNGQLQIYLDDVVERGEVVKKGRTLEIRIDTNYNPSQRVGTVMTDNNSMPEPVNRRVSRSQPALEAPPRAKRSRVDPNLMNTSNEKENGELKMTDARSLSGGERSFSTVAFVLALWHHCVSPFKLMDEIDVFMDMVTRRISYSALINFAKADQNAGQFIFFSPLELPKIDSVGVSVRVFEMPAIIRKRPHSQLTQSEGGDDQ